MSVGGGSAPSTQTVEQRSIPEEFMPYYTGEGGVLPIAYQELFGKEYTPYTGPRVAGMTPLQEQAIGGVASMERPEELGTAAGVMGTVAGGALGTGYTPMPFFSLYTPRGYESGYQAGEMTSPYEAREFTAETAQRMMDPYLQNVLDVERSKALEAYGKGRAQTAAEAVQAGAFGGGRFGVREAEAQRGLESQLAEIQAKGMQTAYQQAREQFGMEEAARQQEAQMAMSAEQQTEAARQAQESARLAGAQLTEQQAQFAENALQNVLSSQEAANQFAATYGQQGLQIALSAGEAMQNLAQTQQALDLARYNAQYAMGRDQQLLAQRRMDQAYADFRNAQDYTRNNIAAFGALLSGVPMPVSSESYQTGSTSPAAQAIGAGLTGLAAYQGLS